MSDIEGATTAIKPGRDDREIHRRRRTRNAALGAILAGFVVLVFAVTVVKLSSGQMIEGFDHTFRPSLVTEE